MQNKQSYKWYYSPLIIPVSIIITGVIISTGIFLGLKDSNKNVLPTTDQAQIPSNNPGMNLEALNPITSEDHIRGNPNAAVKIIEYSDTECPFCKQFQNTLTQIVKDYDGKVAWVYRHFPIDQLHTKARKEAQATECAAEQGGNDKFWQYLDRLFEVTPSNDGLDESELPKIAQYVGLNVNKFNECLYSDRYNQRIDEQIRNAMETGSQGTPWSIVIGKDGKKYPLSGAQPYNSVKDIVEKALQGK